MSDVWGLPGGTRSEHTRFRRFEIGAFRGLREVALDSLGQINLLVGANNAGKTSVLEALAIFCRPLDMSEWATVARAREVRALPFRDDSVSSASDAIRWMFLSAASRGDYPEDPPEADRNDPIRLAADGAPVLSLFATCTRIVGIPPEPPLPRRRDQGYQEEEDGWLVRVSLRDAASLFASDEATGEFPLWSRSGLRYVPRRSAWRSRMEYLHPYSHSSQPQSLKRLSSAIAERTKGEVDRLLREIDPRIEGVEIVAAADGRQAMLAVRHKHNGLLPVAVLGDGLRRSLAIALAVQKASGGVLLIDEIEAALHVSALDRFFPWLAHTCRSFDVQVFATTHSLEAIDAVSRCGRDSLDDLVAYNLVERGASREPKRYTGGMLRRLVHHQGLDVR